MSPPHLPIYAGTPSAIAFKRAFKPILLEGRPGLITHVNIPLRQGRCERCGRTAVESSWFILLDTTTVEKTNLARSCWCSLFSACARNMCTFREECRQLDDRDNYMECR